MVSKVLGASLARRGIHYGWAVVAVTFLTMLVTAGAVGSPGVLIKPLQAEFGWQTSEISSALAVRFALFGLIGPFAAAFMNAFSVRAVVMTALSIIVAGLAGSLLMTQVWQLVLLWGFVVGFGTGLTALVLGATVATRWFSKSRGLVVGLLTASSATGQLVILPAMAGITERYGWRVGVAIICVCLAVAFVAIALVMRDRPVDLGLPVYGETAPTPAPQASTSLGVLLSTPLVVLRDAVRVPVFWILFASFFICGATTNGLIQTHFISLCSDYGIPAVGAAGVLATMGIFDFIGTVGSGWLSDRMDNRWLLFWYYGLRGLSLIYLPFSDFSFYGLSLFAVFYGLDWIATVPPTVRLVSAHFGAARANVVFGWIFAGHQLGAASAAYGAGAVRTDLGTYLPAFFAAGVICLMAAALVMTIRRAPRIATPAA